MRKKWTRGSERESLPQVCTLADLDYDVFHASIDNRSGVAEQEYFIRPRLGGDGAPPAAARRRRRAPFERPFNL